MGCDCAPCSGTEGVLVDVCMGWRGSEEHGAACVEFLLEDALLVALDGGIETLPEELPECRLLTCFLPELVLWSRSGPASEGLTARNDEASPPPFRTSTMAK
jgi:hypothetical protein